MTTNKIGFDKKTWLIIGIAIFAIACATVIVISNMNNAKTNPLVSFIQSDGRTAVVAENATANSSEVVYVTVEDNQILVIESKIDKGEIQAQILPMEIKNGTSAIAELKIKGKETKEKALDKGDYTLQMTASKGTTGSVIIYVADKK